MQPVDTRFESIYDKIIAFQKFWNAKQFYVFISVIMLCCGILSQKQNQIKISVCSDNLIL